MERGAWKAAVHGVAEGRTRLSDFTFTFHFHALGKEMATHSSILAWEIPWTEEPSGPQTTGSRESDKTEHAQTHIPKHQQVKYVNQGFRNMFWPRPVNLGAFNITLPTKVHLVKAMVFPVVMYGYESWTVKKVERPRIDPFELWYWRRLWRVPWTARRSNQSILKEISPGCSLEGLTLKLELQ